MAATVHDGEDHRVRVARARRERMAARLLDAVMACYGEHVQQGPPTVDEVIGRADVSRATFYKYFVSIDAAVDERGRMLVAEMIGGLRGMTDPKFPPAFHLAMAISLFLLRGLLDRTWAAFVSHTDLLKTHDQLFEGLTRHLDGARIDGVLAFDDIDAARTIAIGPMQEVLRTIARGGPDGRAFVEEVMAMILRGLGADRDAATEIVRDVVIYVRGAAPDRLAWWRDPWGRAPGHVLFE